MNTRVDRLKRVQEIAKSVEWHRKQIKSTDTKTGRDNHRQAIRQYIPELIQIIEEELSQ